MALSVNRIVDVQVVLSPMAAQRRGFGTLLILGDSKVLNASEAYRTYTTFDDVSADFGTEAEETLAAQAYFSQSPKPSSLLVGQWRTTPSAGVLTGSPIDGSNFSTFQVEHGGFKIIIDGKETAVDADFREAKNLSEFVSTLASKITTANVELVNDHLVITSKTTGETSEVRFATAPDETVTDFSAKLGLTEESGAEAVHGAAVAETLVEAATRLLTRNGRDFYGLVLALADAPTDDELMQIAQVVEAASASHIFGITLSDHSIAETVYSEQSADLPSKLKRAQLTRTITFYASYVAGDASYQLNKYLAASAFGRMFTVNFSGSNTTLTLKFKQAPSLQPSDLDSTEVTNIEGRNVNVYATYDNGTYIIEPGVMASGMHADERHGLDWLQDAVQTAIFNELYQSKTKIKQTDDGVALLQAAIEKTLQQGVDNGLMAPGQWNSDGFGQLEEGDYLPSGFYVYASPIDDQDQSEREARVCPPFQIAIKLAGAIESVDVTINVNR